MPMTVVAGPSALIDSVGGQGQDGQTVGNHSLQLDAHEINILTPAHKVCVYDAYSLPG